MPCATVSLPTRSRPAPTCEPFRSCWAIAISVPRPATFMFPRPPSSRPAVHSTTSICPLEMIPSHDPTSARSGRGDPKVTSQKYREEWHGSWYNLAMRLTLPEIPEAENTPLVRQLLEIIRTQQDRIQQLEDEILRLKGLKTRPVIAPSPLEHPPRPPREPGQKRP